VGRAAVAPPAVAAAAPPPPKTLLKPRPSFPSPLQLETLNLAGNKLVSEAGLCHLAQRCPALRSLNLTGCEEVTLNGLRALIEGLEYVVEAKTFFGFIPKSDALDLRFRDAQKTIEWSAARRVQEAYAAFLARRRAKADAFQRKLAHAALRVQLAWQRHLRSKKHAAVRLEKRRAQAALDIQGCWRGLLGRRRAKSIREEAAALARKGAMSIPIQTLFRGYLTRLNARAVRASHITLYVRSRRRCCCCCCNRRRRRCNRRPLPP